MNITTNGNASFPVRWKGGEGQFKITGGPDGATVKLVMYDDQNAAWIDAGTDASFADTIGTALFKAPGGTLLGVNTDGGGGSMSLNASLQVM